MALRPVTHLGLCSGIGCFDLALRIVYGNRLRTVGHVERDSYAAAVLVARMEEQALDTAPIWDDIGTFDGGPWRGRVDIVSAGFPCQPFSAAGRGGGLDDDRWIWPDIARIVDAVRPRIVFVENVPGLLKHGLDVVLGDLAGFGFDAEWASVAASDVGAPHRRTRLWLVAHTNSEGLERVGRSAVRHERDVNGRSGSAVADADGTRPERPDGTGPAQREPAGLSTELGDPERLGRQPRAGPSESEPSRIRGNGPSDTNGEAVAAFPPNRNPNDWHGYDGPQPGVLRPPNGTPASLELNERNRTHGNGLVPWLALMRSCLSAKGWVFSE